MYFFTGVELKISRKIASTSHMRLAVSDFLYLLMVMEEMNNCGKIRTSQLYSKT